MGLPVQMEDMALMGDGPRGDDSSQDDDDRNDQGGDGHCDFKHGVSENAGDDDEGGDGGCPCCCW